MTSFPSFTDNIDEEKHVSQTEETIETIAIAGHAAIDHLGRPLISFDPQVEARIRRKIDRAGVPLVALMYMFCFIDVSSVLC